MNAILSAEAETRLKVDGFRVFRHHLVPPNDGGLSLGQLAVAAATIGAGATAQCLIHRPYGGEDDVPWNSRSNRRDAP